MRIQSAANQRYHSRMHRGTRRNLVLGCKDSPRRCCLLTQNDHSFVHSQVVQLHRIKTVTPGVSLPVKLASTSHCCILQTIGQLELMNRCEQAFLRHFGENSPPNVFQEVRENSAVKAIYEVQTKSKTKSNSKCYSFMPVNLTTSCRSKGW